MTSHEHLTLPALDAAGCGLQVDFAWQQGRFAHQVFAVYGQERRPLLQSLEGDDRQLFPPSPPLQQLALEEQADSSIVALLVGMAGKNHWSLSAEARADRRAVRFDVACRVSSTEQGRLGSTYRTVATWQSTDAAQGARAGIEGWACCMRPITPPQARPPLVRLSGSQLVIDPQTPEDLATRRWCYELSLERSD